MPFSRRDCTGFLTASAQGGVRPGSPSAGSALPGRSRQAETSKPAELWKPSAFVAFTVAVALTWSSYKLLWWDEFLAFWTDSHAGPIRLVELQRTWPVSLDPLLYHWMASLAMRLLGASAFALRLPSLFGFVRLELDRAVLADAHARVAQIGLGFGGKVVSVCSTHEGV